ncbi:hypothetical protein N7494_004802 [Penicillium frequentans]|uniref:Uncharacterized protein n=1 Tax=Penicillium frequentans TaxID=3151616 RepID=A0AAD6D1L7_9EURO|nr:hypothetical protein N7494_004802 [Penicillium glabrum]
MSRNLGRLVESGPSLTPVPRSGPEIGHNSGEVIGCRDEVTCSQGPSASENKWTEHQDDDFSVNFAEKGKPRREQISPV